MTFFRDKWLLLLHNQKLFNAEDYENEITLTNSKLNWIAINTQF